MDYKRADLNYNGPEWSKLRFYLTQYLEQLRKENDDKSKNEVDTAFHRGRISQIKQLLNMEPRLDGPETGE